MRDSVRPMIQATMAALLFGASAPLAKLLLGSVEPLPLAALLYLGSGLGLACVRRLFPGSTAQEARLERGDLPWLAGAALAGGVAAPIILMFSLRQTPAATASLLLNFEGVATTLMAALVFHEAVGRRVWWAIAAITLASALLSWETNSQWGWSAGALGVILACVLWGADNNFTRNISAKDPLSIAQVKSLSAGAISFLLAAGLRFPFPDWRTAAAAMLLGSVSYGLSIVLFIRSMRQLGAARTSALFGTAPFAGAVLAVILLREALEMRVVAASVAMALGAAILFGEGHGHKHTHERIEHEHRHRHDDGHHDHSHADGEVPPGGWHSHLHVHEPIEHSHSHAPDIHHRHGH